MNHDSLNSLGDALRKASGTPYPPNQVVNSNPEAVKKEINKKIKEALKSTKERFYVSIHSYYEPRKRISGYTFSTSKGGIIVPTSMNDPEWGNEHNPVLDRTRLYNEGWASVPHIVSLEDIAQTYTRPETATRHHILGIQDTNDVLGFEGKETYVPINIKQILTMDEIRLVTKPLIRSNKGFHAFVIDNSNNSHSSDEHLPDGDLYYYGKSKLLRVEENDRINYFFRPFPEGVVEFFGLRKDAVFDEKTATVHVPKHKVNEWKDKATSHELNSLGYNLIGMLSQAYERQITVEPMTPEQLPTLIRNRISQIGKGIVFDEQKAVIYSPHNFMGAVIGFRGSNIKDMSEMYGRRIQVIEK